MRVIERFPRKYRGAALILLACLAGAAALWSATRARIDYTTQPIARSDIEATVTAIGTLQPRSYVDVGAQVSGQINRLRVQPGDEVKQGQLLVEIDPSVQQATVDAGRAALAGLRAELADQHAQHRLAGQQSARQQQMAQDGSTRAEDLDSAAAAFASASARLANIKARIDQTEATLKADAARLGYTRIYAPMAGTVVSVDAREGQTLNATYQTPNILRIADLTGMTVWTDVSEADVRRVQPGMPAYFTTLGGHADDRARRWEGTVRQVLPAPPTSAAGMSGGIAAGTPAPATKAVMYTVLFDVDNADGELMSHMTALVSFVTARAGQALAAPLAALTARPGVPGSYSASVLRPDGKPELRQVRVGVRSRHLAEVLDGLSEGEPLVTGETVTKSGLRWLQW